MVRALLKVGADTVAEINCLADVDNLSKSVFVKITARGLGSDLSFSSSVGGTAIIGDYTQKRTGVRTRGVSGQIK